MAFDPFIPTFPGQAGGAGDVTALHTPQVAGMVEGTMKRYSVVYEHIPIRDVKGTSSFKNYAHGAAVMQKVVAGNALNSTASESAQRVIIVDTHTAARTALPELDKVQSPYDALSAIALEHGKAAAKLYDTAALIQGVRAGLATATSYTPLTVAAGFKGGSQVTFAAAADRTDSAKLYAKLTDVLVELQLKDVNLMAENVVVYVNPTEYNTLLQSPFLINSQYITAMGNTVVGPTLKLLGVPVMSTTALAQNVVAGHPLQNVPHNNIYDGDYSKVVALVMSYHAVLAGASIPLNTTIWYSKRERAHIVDTDVAIAFGPNRNETAGVLLIP
jgi:hypothetical protein